MSRRSIGGSTDIAGAEQTFIALYEEHFDDVNRFCLRRVARADVDDAVADVFAVVWKRVDEFDPDAGRAWIYGIARNVVRNQWRSTQRRQNLVGRIRGVGSPQPQPPDVVVVRRAEDEAVHRALAGLRPADQDILTLSAWDELTGPEIALVLGISVNAFHQRLFRAKKRLAHRIEQDQPDLVPNLNVQEGSS